MTTWGLTRSWTNAANYSLGYNGSGMVVTQLPHLRQDAGGTLAVISNGTTIRYFDPTGLGGFTERYFGADQFLSDTPFTGRATLTDTRGDALTFYDFAASVPANERGTFLSYTNAAGATMAVTSTNSDGKPLELQYSTGSGASQVVQSYQFTYLTSGVNSGLMSAAVFRRQVGGGSWGTVQQALYSYYDGSQTYGNAGDLQLATVEDGSGNALGTDYYRYYTGGGSGGYVHGLKDVFEAPSYGRLTAALGTGVDSLTDSQVAPYADYSFQYDSSQRVTQEIAAGAGASGGSTPGLGTFTYSYTTSTNTPGLNSWATKTVETLPDGTTNTVYTNAAAEVMLSDHHDGATGQDWDRFYEYNAAAEVVLAAAPSAVTGYSDSYADLLHYTSGAYAYLSSSSGLITLHDYGSSTTATTSAAGDVSNYLKDTKVAQGQAGTAILVSGRQYIGRAGGETTIYPLASRTAYRNTNGTGGETTGISYTWPGTGYSPSTVAVSAPTISSGQDGPGTADTVTTSYDGARRPQWVKDADGFISYTGYDSLAGAVTETIADVNTSSPSLPSGLPSGWTTPSGGGLNLVMQYAVDALGRTTAETDPAGNVTYTVYDDIDHEARVYPGWISGRGTPTGPTQVVRDDYAGGYTEALTMSAAPHLTGGVPDGTEAIGGVQTLSRSLTNTGGQVTEQDDYFDLSGVTYSTTAQLGTSGTNYYATLDDYDAGGRLARV